MAEVKDNSIEFVKQLTLMIESIVNKQKEIIDKAILDNNENIKKLISDLKVQDGKLFEAIKMQQDANSASIKNLEVVFGKDKEAITSFLNAFKQISNSIKV